MKEFYLTRAIELWAHKRKLFRYEPQDPRMGLNDVATCRLCTHMEYDSGKLRSRMHTASEYDRANGKRGDSIVQTGLRISPIVMSIVSYIVSAIIAVHTLYPGTLHL